MAARGAAKHPAVHRTPWAKSDVALRSIVPRLRNCSRVKTETGVEGSVLGGLPASARGSADAAAQKVSNAGFFSSSDNLHSLSLKTLFLPLC